MPQRTKFDDSREKEVEEENYLMDNIKAAKKLSLKEISSRRTEDDMEQAIALSKSTYEEEQKSKLNHTAYDEEDNWEYDRFQAQRLSKLRNSKPKHVVYKCVPIMSSYSILMVSKLYLIQFILNRVRWCAHF